MDLSWGELLVVGVVALIVVGPKELPTMFRTVGRLVGRLQNMANDFRRSMEAAADEAGVKDLQAEMRTMSKGDPLGLNAAGDKLRELNKKSGLVANKTETAQALKTAPQIDQAISDAIDADLAAEGAEAEVADPKPVKSAGKTAAKTKAPAKMAAKTPTKTAIKAEAKKKSAAISVINPTTPPDGTKA